jgi:hypothetical protein
LMIIYIEKSIAKALDIIDIIKNIMWKSYRWDIGYFHILRSHPPPWKS